MHADVFLQEVVDIAREIDSEKIDLMAHELDRLRYRKGTLYLIGLGGSAANCSHAAADFRKLCGIEARTPTDNVAEFSARVNDEGWRQSLAAWLQCCSLSPKDALLVLSVGGGTDEVSQPITAAVRVAKECHAPVLGIVGPDGGETFALGDLVIRVPAPRARITPHTEAFQAVVWHLLVSHPLLQRRATKW